MGGHMVLTFLTRSSVRNDHLTLNPGLSLLLPQGFVRIYCPPVMRGVRCGVRGRSNLPAGFARSLVRNLDEPFVQGQIMTDGVLPAGIAGVVDPVVGVGQDGEEVVVDLGQAQPPQRCGDDGLEGRKEDSRWGLWSLLTGCLTSVISSA